MFMRTQSPASKVVPISPMLEYNVSKDAMKPNNPISNQCTVLTKALLVVNQAATEGSLAQSQIDAVRNEVEKLHELAEDLPSFVAEKGNVAYIKDEIARAVSTLYRFGVPPFINAAQKLSQDPNSQQASTAFAEIRKKIVTQIQHVHGLGVKMQHF
jgi:hypothetical protein